MRVSFGAELEIWIAADFVSHLSQDADKVNGLAVWLAIIATVAGGHLGGVLRTIEKTALERRRRD